MDNPHLSIIIPAYNEMHRIGKTLDSIRAYLLTVPYTAEVVVVINNTTDDTEGVVKEHQATMPYMRVKNIGMSENESGTKGKAVRSGVLEAKGAYILYMDADNATDLAEIKKILAAF